MDGTNAVKQRSEVNIPAQHASEIMPARFTARAMCFEVLFGVVQQHDGFVVPPGNCQRPPSEDWRLVATTEPPATGIAPPGDDINHIAVDILYGECERE